MKQHKYLEDNGIKRNEIMENICEEHGGDARSHHWRLQRKIYGFDERETWALNTAFVQWLLERLLMYKDVASNVIDLTYHKANYKGKLITQNEAIDLMIEACKEFLSADLWDDRHDKSWKAITELWSEWGPVMWW